MQPEGVKVKVYGQMPSALELARRGPYHVIHPVGVGGLDQLYTVLYTARQATAWQCLVQVCVGERTHGWLYDP